MEQIKEMLTGFFLGMLLYTLVVEVIGFFFSGDIVSYTLGLLFGTLVAAVLILHMTVTLDRALDHAPEQASGYVKRQSLVRLALMLLAMVTALFINRMNFITVILGMLGLKIGALIAPFFLKRLYPSHYVTGHMEDADSETE